MTDTVSYIMGSVLRERDTELAFPLVLLFWWLLMRVVLVAGGVSVDAPQCFFLNSKSDNYENEDVRRFSPTKKNSLIFTQKMSDFGTFVEMVREQEVVIVQELTVYAVAGRHPTPLQALLSRATEKSSVPARRRGMNEKGFVVQKGRVSEKGFRDNNFSAVSHMPEGEPATNSTSWSQVVQFCPGGP